MNRAQQIEWYYRYSHNWLKAYANAQGDEISALGKLNVAVVELLRESGFFPFAQEGKS